MSTNNYKSLPELSDEFILDALNSSRGFKELSKKLNCYKKNSNTRKRHIFHYLNQIGIYEMTYEQLKENYNKHNHKDRYCLKCGKKLTIQQMRTNNKFCSNSCANSYNRTGFKMNNEIKSNIREGLINSLKYKENLAKRREENKQRKESKQLKKEEDRQKRKEENKQREELLQIFEQILGKKLRKRYSKKKTKQINCKICGRPLINGKCQNDFCIKHKNIKFNNLVKYFGFDISKYGTELVETEFNRIREMLYDLYWNKHMSSIQLESMFKLSNNTMSHYFKLFNIPRKSLSFAMKESVQENRTKISISEYFKGKFHTHITWDNKEVHLRSTNEIEYAKWLDSQKIIYEVESLRIKYFDTQKNDYRYAIPDFYLPETNTIVEVKSSYTLDVINMKDRCKEFTNLGYNFKLIFDFKEMTLDEILKNNLYDYDKNKNTLNRMYKNKRKDKFQLINKDGIIKKCYEKDDLEQYLNDGWSIGTGKHDKKAGKSRVVRLNEHGFLEYKIIPRSELKEYLNNGWFKGKTLKYEILELLKQKK